MVPCADGMVRKACLHGQPWPRQHACRCSCAPGCPCSTRTAPGSAMTRTAGSEVATTSQYQSPGPDRPIQWSQGVQVDTTTNTLPQNPLRAGLWYPHSHNARQCSLSPRKTPTTRYKQQHTCDEGTTMFKMRKSLSSPWPTKMQPRSSKHRNWRYAI